MNQAIQQVLLNAQAEDMEMIMKAVISRYEELFPDWEISTISIEKGKDRDAQLDQAIALLQSMKKQK